MAREREQPPFSSFFPDNKATFHKEPLENFCLNFLCLNFYMFLFDTVLEPVVYHKLIGNDTEFLILSWINPFKAAPQWERVIDLRATADSST